MDHDEAAKGTINDRIEAWGFGATVWCGGFGEERNCEGTRSFRKGYVFFL